MKKRFLAAALSLGLIAGGFALSASSLGSAQASEPGAGFVDVDGDGICDQFAQREGQGRKAGMAGPRQGQGLAQGEGKGSCDNCPKPQAQMRRAGMAGAGQGQHFVDADGDGICDHRGDRAQAGQGPMKGSAQGQGKGQGPDFVDADGDGQCDRFAARSQAG